MNDRGHYHVFDTALGACAIAWSSRGILRVLLPSENCTSLEAELSPAYRRATRLPAAARTAVERITKHLAGSPQDFSDLSVDLDALGAFARTVYEQARLIPSGDVCTYGELARAVGKPGGARAVGQALGRNPLPLLVPCHRVVAAGGKAGGFSAPGGLRTKSTLLALEGYCLHEKRTLWDPRAREAAVAWLRGVDERLGRIIDCVGPFAMARAGSHPFDALCESVIYQQLAGKAAASITARFLALFQGPPSPATVLAFDDESYRRVGLSSAKIRTLRGLAEAATNGELTLDRFARMTDEDISKQLMAVKGIGPWTVQMLLIFHLGRPDVFPTGDLGIRKAVQRLAGLAELPVAADMEPLAARWKPWRTVATWYLWRSLGSVTLGT